MYRISKRTHAYNETFGTITRRLSNLARFMWSMVLGTIERKTTLVKTLGRRDWLVRSATIAAGAAFAPLLDAETGGYGILGRAAPEIEASYWIDRDGHPTTFSIAAMRGKWIYLKFFQSWCPGCHRYGFPALKKVADRFDGEPRFVAVGLQTVFEGFSINTQDKVRDIQLQYQLPITMGHDAGNPEGDHRPRTMRQYRSGGTPWVVIIDPAGRVVYNEFHIDTDRFIAFLDTKLA